MRIGRWIPCLVGLVLAAGIGFVVHDDESIAKAEPQPAPIVAPRVLMLSGHPGSTQTQLMVASAGTNDTPKAIATLDHIPEAVVKGALLPGGNAALVIADTIPSRELSWAASLMIIEKGQPPRKLVEGVYHAS
ncbi:MAG TPA: hypothetical protein PLV85_09080, partial [Polyangiaceae bacterium]|nr:hypothetical protein [Polyangiaceae bacterium]